MDAEEGPTKIMPAEETARANSAFSLRKPYPGKTASAPVFLQMSRMASLVGVNRVIVTSGNRRAYPSV